MDEAVDQVTVYTTADCVQGMLESCSGNAEEEESCAWGRCGVSRQARRQTDRPPYLPVGAARILNTYPGTYTC